MSIRGLIVVLFTWMCAMCFALAAQATPARSAMPTLQVASLVPLKPAPTPAQVIHGGMDGRFLPSRSTHTPNAVETQRWYRLTIDRDWHETSSPVLNFTGATYIRITVYAPPDYQPHELWFAQTDQLARYSRHHLALELPHDLRADQPIYVQIAADNFTRQIRADITDMATYQAQDLTHVRLTTLFSSVQFTMILAALCLWLVLRDRVLLYFIGYTGCQLMNQLLMSGEMYELPGGSLLVPLGTHAPWLFVALSAPLLFSFILEFCELRQITPRPARALGYMRWPYVLIAALLCFPFAERMHLLASAYNLWFIVTSLWALGTIVLAASRHGRQARFFLVAWLPQVLLTVMRLGQILLALDQPRWLEYGLPFATAFCSIVVTIGLADLSLRARRERDVAHHLADHDALTGLLNRRALVARLHEAVTQARPKHQPLALIFLDLDHFKSVNDRYGHQTGDACLRAVAAAIADELRPTDSLGRYGGEEFVALLPATTHEQAMAVGERIRRSIESLHVHSRGNSLQTTISMGVASLTGPADTADDLIARADAALYRAKTQGRNCVVAHSPLTAVAG
ncbi:MULTISPECIES: sensor domain-containing diguanylate cyclase [unclassified Dyella]|jgi:diguanylate cyclase (GGDEF)-like protein|uniref:sensor domain-containing diguanylate cyclase n=1 Tax=unclassified Dyella TaxID=2634549 RepID=UPI003F8ECEB2